jgi:von Willebrand factor type A domain
MAIVTLALVFGPANTPLLFAQTTAPAADAGVKPKPKTKPREVEIKVRSRAAVEAARTAPSEFLRPPGATRYEPDGTDWRDVPPWRQAAFYGIRAQGQFFIYVVDCSGSMIDDSRLVRAKRELRHSVLSLQPPQRFQVIFYNDRPIPMPGDLPRPADQANKSQMNQWLRLIEPDGATDPRAALGLALAMRPDAIFLLSDGEFPDGTVEAVARKNPHKVPVHCIDLSGGLAGDQLSRIARDSGGRYASRPPRADEVSP